ncbi:hypothetical protein M9H77_01405 [Catharanthus roseus]|uniref:Uncharacterized protein n=1 Tax=Catharanthus roseus TaxID=4058 RepID=A0ACC0C5W4_CATRO|nr:hypothetical protein M9H77_01405 [Catharanthus roseus]
MNNPNSDDGKRESSSFEASIDDMNPRNLIRHNIRNSLEEERMPCTVDLSMLIKLEFLLNTRYVAFSGYSVGHYQRALLGERKVAWICLICAMLLFALKILLLGSKERTKDFTLASRNTVIEAVGFGHHLILLFRMIICSGSFTHYLLKIYIKFDCRSILQLSSEYFSTISITIALDGLSKRKNFSDFNEILCFERELKRIYKRLGMKFKMSQSVRSRIGGNSSITGAFPALSVETQSSSVHRMGNEIFQP